MKRNSQNLFATMNLEALRTAMQNLKGSSFKLWAYFNKNQDNYKFELSQKACAEWGIKKDSYYSAVKDLIDKQYLVPVTQESNIFCFYEIPLSEKPIYFSENQSPASDFQRCFSETTQRNNTNSTIIGQNNIKSVKGKYPDEKEMMKELQRFLKYGMDKYDFEEKQELSEVLDNGNDRRKIYELYDKYIKW